MEQFTLVGAILAFKLTGLTIVGIFELYKNFKTRREGSFSGFKGVSTERFEG